MIRLQQLLIVLVPKKIAKIKLNLKIHHSIMFLLKTYPRQGSVFYFVVNAAFLFYCQDNLLSRNALRFLGLKASDFGYKDS